MCIRVYAASGEESWRTRLTSSGAATTEPGLAGLVFRQQQSAEGEVPVAGPKARLSFEATELGFRRWMQFVLRRVLAL